MKYFYLLLLATFLFAFNAYSQGTGKQDTTITFMDEERSIHYFVPEDYDESKTYSLLIGLHGLGDTGENYSNALYEAWSEVFVDYILVFPDGGSDEISDFFTPSGDEEIIQECIDMFSSMYSIDESQIVLQGFSLGGRSALLYGLSNVEKFKGLMLNTPAIQGPYDIFLNNIMDPTKPFLFENSSKIPIAVINGNMDLAYVNMVNLLNETLDENNAIYSWFYVNGLAHSIPPNQITEEALYFIDNPYDYQFDIGVQSIKSRRVSCTSEYSLAYVVRNNGSETINDLVINYQINGEANKFEFEGEILPYESILVEFEQTELNSGVNLIELGEVEINGNEDEFTENSSGTIDVLYNPSGFESPYLEDFEEGAFPPLYWEDELGYGLLQWVNARDIIDGAGGAAMLLNTPFLFDNTGLRDELITPPIDLSTLDEPSLDFNLAASYIQFTNPPNQFELLFTDTLQVLFSVDCGETYIQLDEMYGDDLLTADSPVMNPNSLGTAIFSPTENDWVKIIYDLSDIPEFMDFKNVIFKFSVISGLGSTIYIDDFKVKELGGSSVEDKQFTQQMKVNVYPNPAIGMTNANFFLVESGNIEVSIIDIMGNEVRSIANEYRAAGDNELQINLNGLTSGMYFIKIKQNNSEVVEKLIVQ